MARAPMPTSRARTRSRFTDRAGFTLLEVLLALAVAALAASLAVPSIVRALDSNADQRAAFHFQRLVMDRRAEALREERPVMLVSTGQQADQSDEDGPIVYEMKLDDGWTYRLAQPLTVSPRGLCDPAEADLLYQNRPRVRLHGAANCTFTREKIG